MKSLVRRSRSLPLGVDLGADSVSIVATDASDGGFRLCHAATGAVPSSNNAPDLRIAQTLRHLLSQMPGRERRAVLAAPAADVVTRTFRVPPGMRRSEADRAAELEADAMVDWPQPERLVALDPIPYASNEMLLSVARAGTIERLVAIARAAGLKPVAVDIPACAWRRAVGTADAVLDTTTDRAALVIFGRPVGIVHTFPPRLVDDRLASGVRAALADARRDGVCDVQTLAVLGLPLLQESISELLASDGYTVDSVRLGEHVAPTWTFAYGLASWSVAPRGFIAS